MVDLSNKRQTDSRLMSSAYTALVSKCLFPLHERLKKHSTVRVHRDMEDTQWWSPEQLRALQLRKLQSLLTEVGEQVPYYRDLFKRLSFNPRAVASLNDLRKLPFLTKTEIRAHTESLKHEQARSLARFNTGGSSGEPLIFFIGKERVSHDVAAKWRATRWWNVDIGDPEIVVWGSPIELGAQDRVRWLRDQLIRTELLPAFEMSDAKLDGFLDAIRSKKPKMLFGYPSALTHIAKHAQKRGLAMNDLGIRVAFVTSERLYDEQRATISQVFGCPVANGYGGRDAGFIAHQCPDGGMHLTSEDIIVELVDKSGAPVPDGDPGEIVVTHLATRDFPFIRYRTGDVAVMDTATCACGRGLPMLKEIQGRTTDFVVAQDGTVLHGLALIYAIRDLPGVESFKIVQENLEHTQVYLITTSAFDPSCIHDIVQTFKKRLGSGVQVLVQQVQTIPPEKSGKFRYVVSRVTSGVGPSE